MANSLPNPVVIEALHRSFSAPADKVAEALSAVVSALNSIPLGNLELYERLIRNELQRVEATESSGTWKFWRKRDRFATWLDLCNGDGWKREAILRTASGPVPNAWFLAFAIRRLNDWVPEVRAAAREHVLRMTSESDAEHVASALWLVLPHLSSWQRMRDSDRDVLLQLTGLEPAAHSLKAMILNATAGPAAAVLEQSLRHPANEHWLQELAFNAIQPTVRAKAFRFLFNGRVTWVVGRDRNLSSMGDEAEPFARLLANDANASVVERGEYALAQLEKQELDT